MEGRRDYRNSGDSPFMSIILRVAFFFGLLISSGYSAIWYVDQSVEESGTGGDWEEAYRGLGEVLVNENVASGDLIFMAAGTYSNDVGYRLPAGVIIFGGYSPGGERLDPNRFRVVLTTQAEEPVLTMAGEGFGQLQDLSIASGRGGGLQIEKDTSIILRRVSLLENASGNSGGGLRIEGGEGVQLICNAVTFFGNDSSGDGGGVFINHCAAVFDSCRFISNAASGRGGAVFHQESKASYYNCLFHHNAALDGGGGAGFDDALSEVSYLNCTVADNFAALPGAGILTAGDQRTVLRNSIVVGEQSSQVAGSALSGESSNNLQGTNDMLFLDPDGVDKVPGSLDDDYRLAPGSMALDAGEDSYIPRSGFETDLAGMKRILASSSESAEDVDLGAFEFLPVIYVNQDLLIPEFQQDGISWDTAYNYLQDALQDAKPYSQIWVASGDDAPDQGMRLTPGRQGLSFVLKNLVQLYGSFPVFRGDTRFRDRDPENFPTVLSGDLNEDDDPDSLFSDRDNSYAVMRGENLGPLTRVDGFVISGGRASSLDVAGKDGAGLTLKESVVTISRCVFLDNAAESSGGGVYIEGGQPEFLACRFEKNEAFAGGAVHCLQADPYFRDCEFVENTAGNQGGGIFSRNDSSVGIEGCLFRSNSAESAGGGCYLSQENRETYLSRCVFEGNTSGDQGGGARVLTEVPIESSVFTGNYAVRTGGGLSIRGAVSLTSCTFQGNGTGPSGGGAVFLESGEPRFRNCVVWNNLEGDSTTSEEASIDVSPAANVEFTYCLVQNMTLSGEGNLNDMDPMFIAPVAPVSGPTVGSDLRLQAGSPARNEGESHGLHGHRDAENQPRVRESEVDMGGYEFQPTFQDRYEDLDPDGDANGNGLSNLFDDTAGFDPTGDSDPALRIFAEGSELFLSYFQRTAEDQGFTPEGSATLDYDFERLLVGADYEVIRELRISDEQQEVTLWVKKNAEEITEFFRISLGDE